MRRISRIDRSVDLLRTRSISQNPFAYRCSACRNQASSFSTSLRGADKESLGQRVRRSLFKQSTATSSDPYTGPSQLLAKEAESKLERKEAGPRAERKEIRAAEDAEDYQPADNGKELETIGGYEASWGEELDAQYPYKLFFPEEKIESSAKATAALHRALVEVFALRQAGRPLSEISQTQPGIDLTENVQINPSESGAILQFLENGSLEQIIQSLAPPMATSKKGKQRRKARLAATSSIDETSEKTAPTESEEDVAADRSPIDPLHPEPTPKIDETVKKENPTESEEDVAADRSTVDPLKDSAEALVASWGNSWLQISLADPAIKFAVGHIIKTFDEAFTDNLQVVKRTMQLTGQRIPDHAINHSSTVEKLLQHLIAPPKPPTLNKALEEAQILSLPNVSVIGKRVTPIDKERNIGRLKVIRQEFKSRGLSQSQESGWTGRQRNKEI
ncbi:hypothetical protein ACHAQE_006501 [Botrytis cinerea]